MTIEDKILTDLGQLFPSISIDYEGLYHSCKVYIQNLANIQYHGWMNIKFSIMISMNKCSKGVGYLQQQIIYGRDRGIISGYTILGPEKETSQKGIVFRTLDLMWTGTLPGYDFFEDEPIKDINVNKEEIEK